MSTTRMDYYCYWKFLQELSQVYGNVFRAELNAFSHLRNPIQTHSEG